MTTDDTEDLDICGGCNGAGIVRIDEDDYYFEEDCEECAGTGVLIPEDDE